MTDRPSYSRYMTSVLLVAAVGITGLIVLPGTEHTDPLSHWLWVGCVSVAQIAIVLDLKRRLRRL